MRYVIIGNSAGALGAIEGIRSIDKTGEIVVVSDEPFHTYARPLISYLVSEKVNDDGIKSRAEDYYDKYDCKFMPSTRVNGIDAPAHNIIMDGGKKMHYDKLLVCTGSSSFVPPIDGLNNVKNKFTFLSLSDAQGLKHQLSKNKRVLILGAGLIGLKCAESISKIVGRVVVVDLAPRVLPAVLDEAGAKIVQKKLEGHNMEFLLGKSIKRIVDDGLAILSDDTAVEFDILVLAAGVRPNTALLKDIAQIEKGIVVNARSETTACDIYSAGDCSETLDISSGKQKIMAILPNAYMQGEVAGINMAGGDAKFDKAIPMNAVGFFGLHIISAGTYEGEVFEKHQGDNYKKLFYSKNRLNGYILIGNVDKAGIYTSLIREQVPLDTIDFPLICEYPQLMAFTKEERAKKLGGING